MVQQHLLLPHLLNSLVSVALQGVVVLVDLDAQAAAGGEVVRLGQVTEAMMLHRLTITSQSRHHLMSGRPPETISHLQDVLHAHPPQLLLPDLVGVGPDLIK